MGLRVANWVVVVVAMLLTVAVTAPIYCQHFGISFAIFSFAILAAVGSHIEQGFRIAHEFVNVTLTCKEIIIDYFEYQNIFQVR